MTDLPTEDKILTTSQAAILVGCSQVTLRRYADEKTVPAKKVAGRWRFSKQKLMEFLKNNS